jgi:cyanate permease
MGVRGALVHQSAVSDPGVACHGTAHRGVVPGKRPRARYGYRLALVVFGDALSRAGQAQLLSQGLGWRTLFLASATGLGMALLLCLLFLREQTPTPIAEASDEPPKPEVAGTPLPPAFYGIAAGALAFTLVNVTLSEWLPLYFSKNGLSDGAAALASGLFPAMGGVSALTFGYLGDRTDTRGRQRLLVGGLLLTALTLGGFLLPLSPLLLVGLAGLVTGGPYAWAVGAAALDLGPKERAAALNGYLDGTGYLGALLAGEAIARLALKLGWNGAFAACALICLLCAAIGAFFSRPTRP